jgi:hypothetical protein
MMKKVTVSVFVVFFVALFLACSSNNNTRSTDSNDTYRPSSSSSLAWDERDGFFPDKDHIYGFDRHPEPRKGYAEDSIAYISVLKGDIGLVKVRITPKDGDDYYICNPNKSSIAEIDSKSREQTYKITTEDIVSEDGIKMIALCKENENGPQMVQKLQIHSYDGWKKYDFDVYTLGSSCMNDDRQPCNDNFWVRYDSVFRQAAVKNDGVLKDYFKTFDKGYVLTRTDGTYKYDECALGDIGEIMDTIFQNMANYEYNKLHVYKNYGLKKRAAIQINYPTKRFWPLTKGVDDKVEICGKPNMAAPSSGLVLESLSMPGCKATDGTIGVVNRNGIWILNYGNGREEIADTINAKPKCMVFAEVGIGDYVGEIGDDALAVMQPLTLERDDLGLYAGVNIVLLPWTEKYKEDARHIAFHELGHTMGLNDLNDKPLSCVPRKDATIQPETGEIENCIEGADNNLMHYTVNSKEHILRKRSIASEKDRSKQENQWECLRRINANKSCLDQKKLLAD